MCFFDSIRASESDEMTFFYLSLMLPYSAPTKEYLNIHFRSWNSTPFFLVFWSIYYWYHLNNLGFNGWIVFQWRRKFFFMFFCLGLSVIALPLLNKWFYSYHQVELRQPWFGLVKWAWLPREQFLPHSSAASDAACISRWHITAAEDWH